MTRDRQMKITVEIPHEGSKLEFSLPREQTIQDLITVFRTIMTYMAWHPDITEAMFKREFLEDNTVE
jgi:hypothetical protein